MRPWWLGFAFLLASGHALAQAAPPTGAPPKAAAEKDDLDDEGEPPAKKNPATLPVKEEPVQAPEKLLPPPADPRLDEQEPRPLFAPPDAARSERHLEIGPDVGIWLRTADSDDVSYAPGLAYGAHARADLWPVLGFRVYFSNARHAVELARGALGLEDTAVDQPDLEVFQLGFRAEPTYMPTSTLRLWAGLGIAWAHVTAPRPTSTGAVQVQYADRTAVFLEYSAAAGATWDFVPDWLAATLSASGGILTSHSGDAFREHTVSDGAGGTVSMGGLPKVKTSFAAHLGVGMIL